MTDKTLFLQRELTPFDRSNASPDARVGSRMTLSPSDGARGRGSDGPVRQPKRVDLHGRRVIHG